MVYTFLNRSLPCYQYEEWCKTSPFKTSLSHGFFTSIGGISTGVYKSLNCGFGSADDPMCIEENRRRVAAGLGFSSDQLFGLAQNHSNVAVSLSDFQSSSNISRPNADAIVSIKQDAALAILTADCVPVLLADRENGVVGAAHAGWRGAMSGILNSAISKMCDNGAKLPRIEAVIGPAIAKDSYQVGNDCRQEIIAHHPKASRFFLADPVFETKYYFDLPAFVSWQLRRIGLDTIVDLAIDTYDSGNNLFSHRRASHADLPETGRQIAVIGIYS